MTDYEIYELIQLLVEDALIDARHYDVAAKERGERYDNIRRNKEWILKLERAHDKMQLLKLEELLRHMKK
jgi:hypothetical protein